MENTGLRERLIPAIAVAWMLFAAFAATDWLGLPGGRGDVRLLLFAALAILVAVDVALTRRISIGRSLGIVLALSGVSAVAFLAADAFHDPGYFDRSEVVTLVRFLATATIAGHGAYRLASSPHRSWLWPSALIALGVFVATLMIPLIADGVNPLAKIVDAAGGNADALIVDVFYAAYESAGVDFEGLGPAFRHETVRIIVLAWAYGLISARPGDAPWRRRLRGAATVAVVALAALALSRFTLLALGIVGVVVTARLIASGRITRRQARTGAVLAAAGAIVVLVAAGELIVGRLTDSDTDSAEIRIENIEQALDTIPGGAWRGVGNAALTCEPGVICSPHFLPLDWWLGGGLIAGVASTVILGLLIAGSVQTGRRYWRSTPAAELDGTTLAAFVLFVMAAINWASTGGGLLSLGLWFGIGAAYGTARATQDAIPHDAISQEKG